MTFFLPFTAAGLLRRYQNNRLRNQKCNSSCPLSDIFDVMTLVKRWNVDGFKWMCFKDVNSYVRMYLIILLTLAVRHEKGCFTITVLDSRVVRHVQHVSTSSQQVQNRRSVLTPDDRCRMCHRTATPFSGGNEVKTRKLTAAICIQRLL